MFNLIVSGALNDRQGSIGADRVFEHTSEKITKCFKPGGHLDEAAVCALPTIFMEEGRSDQIVSFGRLTGIGLRGNEYQLRYYLDPDVPQLRNSDLHAIQLNLI